MIEESSNICRLIQSIISSEGIESLEEFLDNHHSHITREIINYSFFDLCKNFRNTSNYENCFDFLLL